MVLGATSIVCHMFRVVKNLRLLKKHLKKLAWKNGDVFENVKSIREDLKKVQANIDKNLDN